MTEMHRPPLESHHIDFGGTAMQRIEVLGHPHKQRIKALYSK